MYEEYTSKMKKTIEVLKTQFASVRAGRANAAVLDQINVEYYGTDTPINQIEMCIRDRYQLATR